MNENADPISWTPEAFFLQGIAGRIHAVYFPPHQDQATGENVLVVPPFAEEMMRVRRMVSLQARRLSAVGVGTLVFDLFGTGDSEGEFRDADWDVWKSDVGTAFDWLKTNHGERTSLLGIRLGAVLALDYIQSAGDIDIDKTIFWNPVVSGQKNLRDFLLLRVLAGMMQKAMPRVSLDSLSKKLAAGETIEVAGYELSAKLAEDISRLRLGPLANKKMAPVHWIELSAQNAKVTQSPGQQVAHNWNDQGILTTEYKLSGPPFWAEWSIKSVSELLDVTTQIVAGK